MLTCLNSLLILIKSEKGSALRRLGADLSNGDFWY